MNMLQLISPFISTKPRYVLEEVKNWGLLEKGQTLYSEFGAEAKVLSSGPKGCIYLPTSAFEQNYEKGEPLFVRRLINAEVCLWRRGIFFMVFWMLIGALIGIFGVTLCGPIV